MAAANGNMVSSRAGTEIGTASSGMTPKEWLVLVSLSVLWGGSFFFVGVAVKTLPPLVIVALRVSLAAAVLITVVAWRQLPFPVTWPIWRKFLAMGVINNVIPFCLIVWGQTQIASGLASILNATTPVFTVLVAHLLTRDERLSWTKGTGVLLGLVGVAVMLGKEAADNSASTSVGQLAVLGAALSYALAGIYGRRFRALGVTPLVTATGQVCCSALLLLPLAFSCYPATVLTDAGPQAWAAVIGLAFLSTALAYILYFRLLAAVGATNVSLVTLLIPVSAIVLGWVVLGERLALHHFLGMALIACGLVTIDGRLTGWLRPAKFGR